MRRPEFDLPEDYQDQLDDYGHPIREDDEDRWIRQGRAIYEAMSPEERARLNRPFDELLERMQRPESIAAVDQVFRHTFDQS